MRSLLELLRPPVVPPTPLDDPEAQELVTVGVYDRGGSLYLCPTDDTVSARIVKVITITRDVYERYQAAYVEWSRIQQILDGFPKTLRQRKPSVRKARVEIPDLGTQPQAMTENQY